MAPRLLGRRVWGLLCLVMMAGGARGRSVWHKARRRGTKERIGRLRGGEEEEQCRTKFIVVTGGVISGIGKGITASSIGVLMKMMGLRPTAVKIDPYLNCDAGTMSPFEHGEVFVLEDGGECDLDLGNYERFLTVQLRNVSNLTTGKVYQNVIAAERRGDYLGKTVQVVPHITDEIIRWIMDVAAAPVDGGTAPPDVCIIELGGTLGDIESMPFVEALRQLQLRVGWKNVAFLHVSLVPRVGSGPSSEQKSKPTQHSVKAMRSLGLSPDFLMCRSSLPLEAPARRKLSLFCDVPEPQVVSVHDVSNLYRVPILLARQGVARQLLERLRLLPRDEVAEPGAGEAGLTDPLLRRGGGILDMWQSLGDKVDAIRAAAKAAGEGEAEAADPAKNAEGVPLGTKVVIAMVAKYAGGMDAYHSVVKALEHAAIQEGVDLEIAWIDAEGLEAEDGDGPGANAMEWGQLRRAHGVLVPGGFGQRGWEGKVQACRHARTKMQPFLGICLGFQAAVTDFMRDPQGGNNPRAQSQEFEDAAAPAPHARDRSVIYMPEITPGQMGGTMRLGAREARLEQGSLVRELYGGAASVVERHRHRYEVNPRVIHALKAKGLRFTGVDDTGCRMEVLEIAEHPFFLGTQFHPEYASRPHDPSPAFVGLIRAAARRAVEEI